MKAFIPLLLLLPLATACASGPSKSELDAEVKRLCAIDGGIKVYETVKLPASEFDKWGMVKLYSEQRKEIPEARYSDEKHSVMEFALGTEYIFKHEVSYYQKGHPDAGTGEAVMARSHYQIIQRSNGKILAETIVYGRRGGDMPGPWHPSSVSCPENNVAGPNALLHEVFINSNTRGE